MVPTSQPPPWSTAPAPRWSAGRIVALVLGILLLLPAFALLAGGGALLWADQNERSGDGYLFSEPGSFSTGGYALVSDRVDLAIDAEWLPLSAALGTARIQVSSSQPGSDVFVGIAPVADATRYLGGVERSVVDDLGLDAADPVLVPGTAPSGPPGDQDIWVAESSGPGPQQLSWEPAEGTWMLVVMNADGSADVAVDARIGATVPALAGLAWGLLGGGAFLLLIAGIVLALAIRRPVRAAGPPYAGYPVPPPAGPPPYWVPPAPVDRSTAADAQPGTAPTEATPRGPTTG
jgi:hypothetical protein